MIDLARAHATLAATADTRGHHNYRVAAAALGCSVAELKAALPQRSGRPRAQYAPALVAAVVAAVEAAGHVAGAARALGRSEAFVRAVLAAAKSGRKPVRARGVVK